MTSTKPLSKPGGLQLKIIMHLLNTPKQNIVQIQTGIGSKYHSAISRAVKSLSGEDIVKEIDTDKPERGPIVSLYGLTLWSFWNILLKLEPVGEDAIKYLSAYVKIYPEIEYALNYFKALEKIAPKEGISEEWLRTYALLRRYNYSQDMSERMCKVYAYNRLGFTRLMPFLEEHQGKEGREAYEKELKEYGSEIIEWINRDYKEFVEKKI